MRIFLFMAILLCCPQSSYGQTNTNNSPSKVANPNTGVLANNDEPKTDQNNKTSDSEQDANWIIAKLTAALVFIGAIQAFIYWRQSRLMRDTVEHSRESSERGLRAYVGLGECEDDGLIHQDDRNLPPTYKIMVKNYGQTPAYDVTVNMEWRSVIGIESHWPESELFILLEDDESIRRRGKVVLGKDQSFPAEIEFIQHADGSTFFDAYNRLCKREVTLFFYGAITYRDIYQKSHFTRFCTVLRHVKGESFLLQNYDRHNEAD